MVSDIDRDTVQVRRASGRGWALLAAVLAASAAVVAGVWLYASPYVLLQQFRKAVEAGDAQALGQWADDPAVQAAAVRLATAARGDGGEFEAAYDAFDSFVVRISRDQKSVKLRFRRQGLGWRLSRIEGLPEETPQTASVSAPASPIAALLGSPGMPAAQFLAVPVVREKLQKLLAEDLPVFTADLAASSGLHVQGTEISISGCAANACKASEAAMTLDTASGDASAAILKNGALTIYSDKIAVVEQLPKGMQTWLDRLAAQDNAAIPVSFHN